MGRKTEIGESDKRWGFEELLELKRYEYDPRIN